MCRNIRYHIIGGRDFGEEGSHRTNPGGLGLFERGAGGRSVEKTGGVSRAQARGDPHHHGRPEPGAVGSGAQAPGECEEAGEGWKLKDGDR